MAKITITIEDLPEGKVSIHTDPTFEKMAMMAKANAATSAHGYAMRCLNVCRLTSKSNEKKTIIHLPRLRG